jgi:t-SNARE complex subunit (syntaxin)
MSHNYYTSSAGGSSRQSLNSRSHQGADHLQVRIDPGNQYDFDAEVEDLTAGVKKLKNISMAIQDEVQVQNQLLESLSEAMERAQVALKRNMKRLDKAFRQAQGRHMIYLILFCFLIVWFVYFMRKVNKWGTFIFGHKH